MSRKFIKISLRKEHPKDLGKKERKEDGIVFLLAFIYMILECCCIRVIKQKNKSVSWGL
jgi:hypothetical protein